MSLLKIVIIGPESTGKSTLSEALAAALHTIWVPEYARQYLEQLSRPYEEKDLLEIAKRQLKLEDELAASANKILVCDTDLYVIKVWSEAKYGSCNTWVLEQIAQRKYDHYFLTDIDIDWQDDPLREHPLPEERQYFYSIYKDIMANSNTPWTAVRGNMEERLNICMGTIDKIIRNKM